MAINFSGTSPKRSDEIFGFLSQVFGLTDVPTNLRPEVQAWKYFAPHPWWPAPRSYVLETESGIAAHGCVAPVRYLAGDTVLDSMVIIDWAAGKLIPGAGLLLYRRCMEFGKCSLLALGGSDDTLRILPKVPWFAPKADLEWFARTLKPWGRFRRSSRKTLDLLKLVRDLKRNALAPLPSPGGWTCRLGHAVDPVFTPAGDFVPILRTREWIDYLSACPGANCRLWILESEGVAAGHALIANLAGSVRIADFAIGGNSTPAATLRAFSALVRSLQGEKDVLEIVAASSLRHEITAFQACGLRSRRKSAVLLADPRKTFPANATLEIKPIMADSFYLYDASNPFLG